MATTVPSADKLTEYPLWSPTASPSISAPRCVHADPNVVVSAPGGVTITLTADAIVEDDVVALLEFKHAT